MNPYIYTFGTYSQPFHADWTAFDQDGDGIDAPAFLLTGVLSGGDYQRNKQINYLTMHFKKTETFSSCTPINMNVSTCGFGNILEVLPTSIFTIGGPYVLDGTMTGTTVVTVKRSGTVIDVLTFTYNIFLGFTSIFNTYVPTESELTYTSQNGVITFTDASVSMDSHGSGTIFVRGTMTSTTLIPTDMSIVGTICGHGTTSGIYTP